MCLRFVFLLITRMASWLLRPGQPLVLTCRTRQYRGGGKAM
jgi:hypothetical protein